MADGLLTRIIREMKDGDGHELARGLCIRWQDGVDGCPIMTMSRRDVRPSNREVEIIGECIIKRLGHRVKFKHEEEIIRGWYVRRLVVVDHDDGGLQMSLL